MTNNKLNKIKNVVVNHYADDLGRICLGAMLILLWCIIMANSPVMFLGTLAIVVGYAALTVDEDDVEEIIII